MTTSMFREAVKSLGIEFETYFVGTKLVVATWPTRNCSCASPNHGRIGTADFWTCQHCAGHID